MTRRPRAHVARPRSAEEAAEAIAEARRRGLPVLPRGSAYSFGDVVLNEGGVVLDCRGLDRILAWDPERGLMRVEPGVTFAQALALSLPANRVLGAVPGTARPTIGGSLSTNVHGKNAYRDGKLGDWVESFRMLLADGRVVSASRTENPDLFRAAIGGLGLLGVLVEIEIRLKAIPSPYLRVEKRTAPGLDALLDELEARAGDAEYFIAWVDCSAGGRSLGRGTIHSARFVEAPEGAGDLAFPTGRFLGIPREKFWPAVRPFVGRALLRATNAAKYHHDRRTEGVRIEAFPAFTFLIDGLLPEHRLLFRPLGYYESEPVIPRPAAREVIREILNLCLAEGFPSYFCGMKRLRPDDALLSFGRDGYCLGIDIPRRPGAEDRIRGLYRRIHRIVADAGGAAYLAKDETLEPAEFRRMYPNWRAFLEVKRRYDPEGLFSSEMYRRLFL